MRVQTLSWLRALAWIGIGISSVAASAEETTLQWQAQGLMAKVGYYNPVQLAVSDKQPESIKKLPEGVEGIRFGTLQLGPAEQRKSFVVALHEPKTGDAMLWVDANGNGDLTDDKAVEWPVRVNRRGNAPALRQWNGKANVDVPYGNETKTLSFSLYRFDPEDPNRQNFKNTIFYYREYGYLGEVKLGDKNYKAALVDDASSGDFRGIDDPKDSKVSLLIDVNGGGSFDLRGERFDVRQPFNISGTTYEVTGLSAMGGKFEIIKSSKKVPEKAVPSIVAKGKQPPSFEAKTITGKTIKFPQDFADRLVMLDFWATWCGPCRDELPNLRRVYEEFHSQGFDVLGISIDDPENREKLTGFIKDHGIEWQQVNEDAGFEGRLSTMYGVTGIPACWLIDGKSGLIVADSSSLRGPNLRDTIERRLEKLGQPPTDESEHSQRAEDPLLAKAREAIKSKDFLNGAKFVELRRAPSKTALELPKPGVQPLRGREIAQRAKNAHVRCGWVFHCSKCDRWHLQVAGGYAIASDAIVTAQHVMAEPSSGKLDEAFPIVVIGEDQFAPVTEVVAADPGMDTIVMRVGTKELRPVTLNDDAHIGDAVYCFSDPQGVRGYFSSGMINRHFSLRSGSVEPRHQRLHVSADWSKGSSGSAVLDEYGNAIGHVVRIQPLFLNGDRATDRGATVMNLHEAVPAKSVLSLLKAK